jgi:DNA polymerase III delta prime subunit
MVDFEHLWTEAFRPQTLNDIVLSKDDREFFQSLNTQQEIPHLLFAGVQGTGKTSLSRIIVNDILDCQYQYINASDENGIDTVRGKIIGFAKTKALDGKIKVVLLDEADSITLEGQKALRNVMEEYASNTRFIMTCNYLHKIIPPIQSRCQIVNLIPPVEGVLQRVVAILKQKNVTIPPDQKEVLLKHIKKHLPDLRRIINDIQKFSVTGTLKIKSEISTDFVRGVFESIRNKEDICAIRKHIIENEKCFSNDYRHFLKEMFEIVYSSDLSPEVKASCLLSISDSMYNDAIVVDKEINCFSALINLSHNIRHE